MKFIAKILLLLIISCSFSCSINELDENQYNEVLEYGSDFSIMKKMEDFGGVYKIDGVVVDGFQIFKKNGFSWARLRIFHTPNMKGSVCNDLNYTIALAKKAKLYGFKVLLNFHYSDTWADPGHQSVPAAWKNLSFEALKDSVFTYTKHIMETMDREGVLPEMVQIGNEINNGMLWPYGKLWFEDRVANWDGLSELIKAAINGVKAVKNAENIPIMLHAATGGDLTASEKFYKNIIYRGVDFDVIGLSYYPWWHGNLEQLEKTIYALSVQFKQDLSIVETAYYSNGWYPEPSQWVLNSRPYPPTEIGQYNFLLDLAETLKNYNKVKSVFYWKPDELDIPESKVPYLGRSLFDAKGNTYKGITAWKNGQ